MQTRDAEEIINTLSSKPTALEPYIGFSTKGKRKYLPLYLGCIVVTRVLGARYDLHTYPLTFCPVLDMIIKASSNVADNSSATTEVHRPRLCKARVSL